jgi:hypothetical protein
VAMLVVFAMTGLYIVRCVLENKIKRLFEYLRVWLTFEGGQLPLPGIVALQGSDPQRINQAIQFVHSKFRIPINNEAVQEFSLQRARPSRTLPNPRLPLF